MYIEKIYKFCKIYKKLTGFIVYDKILLAKLWHLQCYKRFTDFVSR